MCPKPLCSAGKAFGCTGAGTTAASGGNTRHTRSRHRRAKSKLQNQIFGELNAKMKEKENLKGGAENMNIKYSEENTKKVKELTVKTEQEFERRRLLLKLLEENKKRE